MEPEELEAYSVYEFAGAKEIFRIGYEHANEKLDKFLENEVRIEKDSM
jgi:hypothetical protein